MSRQAYACRISRENKQAINSEKPDFDEVEFFRWLEKHGSGYFLRDENSSFDCKYFEESAFLQIYRFDSREEGLFRPVSQLP